RCVDAGLVGDQLGQAGEDLVVRECHGVSFWGCRGEFGSRNRGSVYERMRLVQGSTTTCAANTSPAPKPICSARPPLSSGRSCSRRWVASGIEAADVLPV